MPGCLQSLRDQDYPGEYEVIVVDNGSTDGTAEVARRLGAIVVHCLEKGVAFARQAGLESARGEIVVQCDADSVVPRNWLSKIARHFETHAEDVGLSGDAKYRGEPLWHRPLSLINRWLNQISYWCLRHPMSILAGNFAARREALIAVGGYDLAFPQCGDEFDLLLRLAKTGRISYDPHLMVETSSRRFRRRFWQFLLADTFYHTALGLLFHRLTGKPIKGSRRDVRDEALVVRTWPWASRLRFATPVVLVLLVGALAYGFFMPSAEAFGKLYFATKTHEKVVALTFDDGPNEPYTSQVLDILQQYDIKATFFVVGKNVAYYPETAKRIVAEGHVLGNHSWDHSALQPIVDVREVDLAKSQATIEKIAGVRPHLFRPPFGHKTPWQMEQLEKHGMVVVTWNVSANDPKQPPSSVIAERIIKHTKPGAIILLHDGNETIHGADRSNTIAVLPQIIDTLNKEGYTFVTVPELLKVDPYLR
ncbi:MAG: polysaccharide deacetylase family protein [Chloroflexi bacterium]|nr:polysaccharide deacetylase family protein [Chloroflexota bacterium]